MVFPNARPILKSGVSLDSYKLLVMAAARSRPRHKALCCALLNPFIHDSEVSIHIPSARQRLTVYVRMPELESDWMSVHELGIRHIYRLEPSFMPDLIIDGGGNTGIFTLLTAQTFPSAAIVTCEPVPANMAQIEKHLRVNHVRAELLPVCIGGQRRKIPFYVREANQGSFEPTKPYRSTLEVEVLTLAELVSSPSAERILIKLDIEGMEIEALQSYLPGERRAVCVVGELHDHKTNSAALSRIFEACGWALNFSEVSDAGSIFDAWSPAAVSHLRMNKISA